MPDTIYLYIKTHNKTGLKYLGKTKKNPYEYKGSGVYWKRHIKKHGYDVTTKILAECNSEEEIKKLGLYYSDLYSVVESNEWANLMEENGIGGITSGCFQKGTVPANKGKLMPVISQSKIKYWENWRSQNPEYKSKWKINNYQKKGYANVSKIAKQKAAINNTKLLVCPHCNKKSNVGNAKRWHFDNCKVKRDNGHNKGS